MFSFLFTNLRVEYIVPFISGQEEMKGRGGEVGDRMKKDRSPRVRKKGKKKRKKRGIAEERKLEREREKARKWK